MLYHALEYTLFVAASLIAYYLVAPPHRWIVLVFGGGAFLAHAGLVNVVVALALATVNYATALLIERWAETRRAFLTVGVALFLDVAILVLFKYGSTIADHTQGLAAGMGGAGLVDLVLPVGLSYYAFQVIGYNLEVYWGRKPAERRFGPFCASIFFFPKLVAGPIERPHRFLPQLDQPKRVDWQVLASAIQQIGWGVFKKCVIADRIGLIIDPIYGAPHEYTGLALVAAIVLYPIQIYSDFSGYTDIALGTARLFGIELTPNFNRPFSARSISDFWRRWHISLSSWTNDYIYRPLSMSMRSSKIGTVSAVLITFLVLGCWHGPQLTFAVFGLLNGAAVAVESLTQRWRQGATRPAPRLPDRLANLLTLAYFSITCVFFRAAHIQDTVHILGRSFVTLTDAAGLDYLLSQRLNLALVTFILVLIALVRSRLNPERPAEDFARWPAWFRWPVYYAIAFSTILLGVFATDKFVYEQF